MTYSYDLNIDQNWLFVCYYQPQIRLYFRYFENSKQRCAWGYEICFVWECCADGVNKNLMKFSQLMRFHRRNIHKQNKSRNLKHTLHRKILSIPVFLESYFRDQIYSWFLSDGTQHYWESLWLLIIWLFGL